MRVLMFGWEFPPYVSGGLGTACYGMTKALAGKGTEILFVLPCLPSSAAHQRQTETGERLKLFSASGATFSHTWSSSWVEETVHDIWENRLSVHPVESSLFPYATAESYLEYLHELETRRERNQHVRGNEGKTKTSVTLKGGYGPDLMAEVFRYSEAAAAIALREDFDVIHVHDWMTYPAGMLVKKLTGKPLVAHIHATERDRSGLTVNEDVARIERAGMMAADVVIAVSHFTRELIMQYYGIPPEKISVVHNAVARSEAKAAYHVPSACQHEKRVLFMGRVTYQKGPDYFVEAAHLVLRRMPGVRFVMAGSGDMLSRMVRRVAQLRMGNRFHFTGFLKGSMVDQMYATSDLYVMPSVSEPFGIAPLEAMVYDTPVLMSRQSGVAEVVKNALKVDFWDIREMANKICAVLSYPKLSAAMVRNCREELKSIKWENSADLLNSIYCSVCERRD